MSTALSQVSEAFVEQFFEREKEDARRWLRSEMDGMVNTLFGQLKTKFIGELASKDSTSGNDNDGDHNNEYEDTNLSTIASSYSTATTSRTSSRTTPTGTSHPSIVTIPNPTIEVVDYVDMKDDDLTDEDENQDDQDEQKSDFDRSLPLDIQLDESPESYFTDHDDQLEPSTSSNIATLQPLQHQTLNHASIDNGTTNGSMHNDENNPYSGYHKSSECIRRKFGAEFGGDVIDCDCDECQNDDDFDIFGSGGNGGGGSSTMDSSSQDNHNSQDRVIKYENPNSNGSNVRPLKKYRFELLAAMNQNAPPEQELTEAEQEENEKFESTNKHVMLTLSVKCPQPGCSAQPDLNFANEAQLTQHLRVQHQILPFRCYQMGCTRSFEDPYNLDHHINYGHESLIAHQATEWTCDKCYRRYTTHRKLYYHHRRYHQTGQFRCALKNQCAFVGNTRDELYKHNTAAHAHGSGGSNRTEIQNPLTPPAERQFACPIPQCGRSFGTKTLLKRHQRFHTRIKPYRCRYPDCGYASEVSYAAVTHIRTVHYNLPATLKEQRERGIVDDRDPKDLLQVCHELLD